MKVVLSSDVEKLGGKGEWKEVSRGYFRNFLYPRGLAFLIDEPQAIKIQSELAKKLETKKEAKERHQALAQSLESKEWKIEAKAGKEGKLFGAVTKEDIASSLKIDKNEIEMAPIKTLGENTVIVNLGEGIRANVIVKVVPKPKSQQKT